MTTPSTTAWLAAYCAFLYVAAGLGVVIGYHRMLTHRAFAAPKLVARILVTLGLPAGTPIQWVGNHRHHHAFTDRDGDPHSPHLDGFWYAHVGWYLGTHATLPCVAYAAAGPLRLLFDAWHRPRTNRQWDHLAPDVAADPYFRFMSRPLPYFVACWALAALLVGAPWLAWGGAGLAAAWLMLVVLYNLGDAIDSVAHLNGKRPYASTSQARNNAVLGVLIGEGWHANHHAFPSSANHALLPRQIDWLWQIIRLMRVTGLATNVVVPAPADVHARAAGASA